MSQQTDEEKTKYSTLVVLFLSDGLPGRHLLSNLGNYASVPNVLGILGLLKRGAPSVNFPAMKSVTHTRSTVPGSSTPSAATIALLLVG